MKLPFYCDDPSQNASPRFSSRRDFLKLALAASSLPLLPNFGFGSVFNDERTAWYRAAKFGMFIHWGLYAVPEGQWKGKPITGLGEWIMNRAKIPVKEYEQLAARFNPVKFNAAEWVRIAKDAGMKYIVITSKHHDGFAMYDSKVSSYDIVDSTAMAESLGPARADHDASASRWASLPPRPPSPLAPWQDTQPSVSKSCWPAAAGDI